jgi:hypothetical protein
MLHQDGMATCPWDSKRPFSIIHAPATDRTLGAIAGKLAPAFKPATSKDDLFSLASAAGREHTSIDMIGHTENGAIRVGAWRLREVPSVADCEMFERISQHMDANGIGVIRFLGCGALLRSGAVRGLRRLESILQKRRGKAEVYGTTVRIDETSFDHVEHRFSNELRCGVLRRPRLLEFLGEFSHVTQSRPSSYLVGVAERERQRSRNPQWPIVVSTSLVDLARILSAARSDAERPEIEPAVELIFVDPASPGRGVRLFLAAVNGRILMRIEGPLMQWFDISRDALRLGDDAIVM